MNIGVIGGGSIGLLLSGLLACEHSITVYVRRKQQKEKINQHGLLVVGSPHPIKINALLIEELKKEDCLIVCVKQNHIASIVPKLVMVDKSTPLVFLQNGMGHVESLSILKQPIILGVTEHGALRLEDNVVEHTGKGSIKLASHSSDEEFVYEFAEKLTQPLFPVSSYKDWSKLLAEKLVINSVINPLTALLDFPNGTIVQNSFSRKLAKGLCAEAALILGLDPNIQWDRVKEVAKNTEGNISSMLKDIRERRETEIEAISGYLIKKNNQNHTIPYTSFVYNSIKALELKRG
ncbi:2-dehydropantoate 2-reductase [Virgibacillus sp. C22-A2]|uniref:2-dehydropantoate 2-reductase n=1 Tax=Virgibacillus tibetensis TaxID=3042313 RepID=A0ABU6KC99_9BACI|nr:2-dehydropantoate 2-reductase [Virgibacillus sp. C22-A2]